MQLNETQQSRLIDFAKLLINQGSAKVVVPPQREGTGHWFGGGNMAMDADGNLWLVGRYRNHGDSRTGLGMGERGLELAIFSSTDNGNTFTKSLSWSKSDLNIGDREVLSIEGTALNIGKNGVELYLSTEKTNVGYPAEIESYLKPGTGVWTIDRMVAGSIEDLPDASNLKQFCKVMTRDSFRSKILLSGRETERNFFFVRTLFAGPVPTPAMRRLAKTCRSANPCLIFSRAALRGM